MMALMVTLLIFAMLFPLFLYLIGAFEEDDEE